MSDDKWKSEGVCAQTDPDAYFPEPGGSSRDAKQTCMVCEVRPQCLQYAIDTEQYWGVWGGVTQNELRRMIRARRATAA